jgi:hypothetical protein
LSADGLIMAGSMAMLDSARHGEKSHWLARTAVLGGILGSLAANAMTGISHGILGAVIAGWPALALVVAYELIMVMLRSASARSAAADDVISQPVPEALEAVAQAYPPIAQEHHAVASETHVETLLPGHLEPFSDDIGQGVVPGVRDVMRRASVGYPAAKTLLSEIAELVGAMS